MLRARKSECAGVAMSSKRKERPGDTRQVARLRKNSSEVINLKFCTYRGHRLLNIAVLVAEPGKPDTHTGKAFGIRPDLLAKFIRALRKAERIGQRENWL